MITIFQYLFAVYFFFADDVLACNSVSESEMRAALTETVSVVSKKMEEAIDEALSQQEAPEKAVFTHAHVSRNSSFSME